MLRMGGIDSVIARRAITDADNGALAWKRDLDELDEASLSPFAHRARINRIDVCVVAHGNPGLEDVHALSKMAILRVSAFDHDPPERDAPH